MGFQPRKTSKARAQSRNSLNWRTVGELCSVVALRGPLPDAVQNAHRTTQVRQLPGEPGEQGPDRPALYVARASLHLTRTS